MGYVRRLARLYISILMLELMIRKKLSDVKSTSSFDAWLEHFGVLLATQHRNIQTSHTHCLVTGLCSTLCKCARVCTVLQHPVHMEQGVRFVYSLVDCWLTCMCCSSLSTLIRILCSSSCKLAVC